MAVVNTFVEIQSDHIIVRANKVCLLMPVNEQGLVKSFSLFQDSYYTTMHTIARKEVASTKSLRQRETFPVHIIRTIILPRKTASGYSARLRVTGSSW